VDLDEMKRSFHQHGYAVARGLFSQYEVDESKVAFDDIAKHGPIVGHFDPASAA